VTPLKKTKKNLRQGKTGVREAVKKKVATIGPARAVRKGKVETRVSVIKGPKKNGHQGVLFHSSESEKI